MSCSASSEIPSSEIRFGSRNRFKPPPEVPVESIVEQYDSLFSPKAEKVVDALHCELRRLFDTESESDSFAALLTTENLASLQTLSALMQSDKYNDFKFSGKHSMDRYILLDRELCAILTTDSLRLAIMFWRIVHLMNGVEGLPAAVGTSSASHAQVMSIIPAVDRLIDILLFNRNYFNVALLPHNTRSMCLSKGMLYVVHQEQLKAFSEATVPMLLRLCSCLHIDPLMDTLHSTCTGTLVAELTAVLRMIDQLVGDTKTDVGDSDGEEKTLPGTGVPSLSRLMYGTSLTVDEIREQVVRGCRSHLLPFSGIQISHSGSINPVDGEADYISKLAGSLYLVDNWVSHLVFDRLHLMVGLADTEHLYALSSSAAEHSCAVTTPTDQVPTQLSEKKNISFRDLMLRLCIYLDSHRSDAGCLAYAVNWVQLLLRIKIVSHSLDEISHCVWRHEQEDR